MVRASAGIVGEAVRVSQHAIVSPRELALFRTTCLASTLYDVTEPRALSSCLKPQKEKLTRYLFGQR
ncbi:hypothetical protein GGTG_07084 [Gaeumannomyces tritici R3-111a-1]|uniref:Uncharacterized protein n=1 Tax=Gaeumannomyces tritici (strain R3-111a-1) TaxID=644352 RepID=J3P0N9_GAET3|nr:hypothetical protein GGTG_07084 [Gaeumannomyces tritici R3-111a-1]EJT77172.1 hypothetical protein GGTG_07084 [Gaeumannomyces tritici R3-111a-1]